MSGLIILTGITFITKYKILHEVIQHTEAPSIPAWPADQPDIIIVSARILMAHKIVSGFILIMPNL